MARLAVSSFLRWLIGFFDLTHDGRLTFGDLSMLVAGFIFTLKMVGLIDGPDDPSLWVAFMVSIAGYAGVVKVAEVIKS